MTLWATEADQMDTQRSFFVESGRYTTKYLRILRVSFVHPFDGRELAPQSPPLLSYVTFEPIMLSSGGIIGIPLFEKLSETMKRAMTWLNRTALGQLTPVNNFSLHHFSSAQRIYFRHFTL